MILAHAREVLGWAPVLARVAANTQLVGALEPEGLLVTARQLLQGKAGLSSIFRIRAAGAPDALALVANGVSRTYGEVDARIDRLAAGLRRLGIGRRDAVAVMLHNCAEFFEVESAMSRLGGSSVSVSWRSTEAELLYVLQHAGVKAIFLEPELAEKVEAVRDRHPTLTRARCVVLGDAPSGMTAYEELLSHGADRREAEEEGAVIIYTSGTTGKPKGAVRRFGPGQVLAFAAFLERVPLRRSDRHLCVCPLYHSTALGFAGLTLTVGGTVVIERDFEPLRFLRAVERHGVTTTAIVPTMLHRLMALDEGVLRAHQTDTLRVILCGGAQLPPPLAIRTRAMLGPRLYNFYGATETGLVTVATPDDLAAVPGTIGRALHGNEVRLLDEAGRDVGPGEVGELYVRNRMLVEGYHADDAATQASMRDGFFSVGDLATMDAAGRYTICGRRRDMVISGGVNLYPAEIEAEIDAHPAVSQSAVIGVPDPEWGERLRAFVVLRAGHAPDTATAESLRAWCRGRLSGPKAPKEWAFVEALPSNPTGKILKRALREYDGEVVRA